MSKERENELLEHLKMLLVEAKKEYISYGDLVQEIYDLIEMYPELIEKYEKELDL